MVVDFEKEVGMRIQNVDLNLSDEGRWVSESFYRLLETEMTQSRKCLPSPGLGRLYFYVVRVSELWSRIAREYQHRGRRLEWDATLSPPPIRDKQADPRTFEGESFNGFPLFVR